MITSPACRLRNRPRSSAVNCAGDTLQRGLAAPLGSGGCRRISGRVWRTADAAAASRPADGRGRTARASRISLSSKQGLDSCRRAASRTPTSGPESVADPGLEQRADGDREAGLLAGPRGRRSRRTARRAWRTRRGSPTACSSGQSRCRSSSRRPSSARTTPVTPTLNVGCSSQASQPCGAAARPAMRAPTARPSGRNGRATQPDARDQMWAAAGCDQASRLPPRPARRGQRPSASPPTDLPSTWSCGSARS